MKYRNLRIEELEEVQDKFVLFLSANGLDAKEWELLKGKDEARVNELIGQFSDIVFDNVLNRVEYLIGKSKQELRCIKIDEQGMSLYGFKVDGDVDVDFRTDQSFDSMLEEVRQKGAEVFMTKGSKEHKESKNMEIFKLMERGMLIADSSMYEMLASMESPVEK